MILSGDGSAGAVARHVLKQPPPVRIRSRVNIRSAIIRRIQPRLTARGALVAAEQQNGKG